jgi:hypothetical protein
MLNKLLPKSVKRTLRNKAKQLMHFKDEKDLLTEILASRKRQEEAIPKMELSQKHINHLRVLLNREAFLHVMPKHGVCAEIGVNRGEFSEEILRIMQPAKLHLVDVWADEKRYHSQLRVEVENKFQKEIQAGTVQINVGYSTDVLKTFPDAFFDWVYVDTDHSFQTTRAELEILRVKMKPNGIIAGHDYTLGNWIGNYRYGVIEAVHELCVKDDWELVWMTCETHQCRNFAIRKINPA